MTGLSLVYWIHLPEHTDFTREGYIGITTRGISRRFQEHLKLADTSCNTILYKAIRKYRDKIVVDVLLEGSEEYCLLMEYKLRSEDCIGWNTIKGGGMPPMINQKHTEEAKAKIGEASRRTSNSLAHQKARAARVGKKFSEDTKLKLKEKAQGRLPWDTSRSDISLWLQAEEFYNAHKQNPKFGYIKLGQMFGLSKYALQNMYLKFTKHNWIPAQDPLWLNWIQNI